MQLRENNITQLERDVFDVLIVGGGINGAVSAASLAAKVLSGFALIDRGDFAGEVQFSLVQSRLGQHKSTWRTLSFC